MLAPSSAREQLSAFLRLSYLPDARFRSGDRVLPGKTVLTRRAHPAGRPSAFSVDPILLYRRARTQAESSPNCVLDASASRHECDAVRNASSNSCRRPAVRWNAGSLRRCTQPVRPANLQCRRWDRRGNLCRAAAQSVLVGTWKALVSSSASSADLTMSLTLGTREGLSDDQRQGLSHSRIAPKYFSSRTRR
jgi:hypothetical protein